MAVITGEVIEIREMKEMIRVTKEVVTFNGGD